MLPLSKEYKYYIDNYDTLVQNYEGKVLIIVGNNVVGVYDDEPTAYSAGKDQYGLGHFMMQTCTQSEKGYHISYHSRVN